VKEIAIAALGPALVLFISEIFRCYHTKKEREERFFYELYPKRLELYEVIIKNLTFLDDIENVSKTDSAFEISATYMEGIKRLFELDFRCRLFGSGRVITAFNALAEALVGQYKFVHTYSELFSSEAFAFERIDSFTEAVSARKGTIMALIQAEAGTDFIDKKIFNIAPVLNKKKNKLKEKVKSPR
jgi:hypothetical protein